MKIYTYSEARQRLAQLLDEARRNGRVQIRRRDGQLFTLTPAAASSSPLDVPAIRATLRSGELAEIIREGREAGDRFFDARPSGVKRVAESAPPRTARKTPRGRKK